LPKTRENFNRGGLLTDRILIISVRYAEITSDYPCACFLHKYLGYHCSAAALAFRFDDPDDFVFE